MRTAPSRSSARVIVEPDPAAGAKLYADMFGPEAVRDIKHGKKVVIGNSRFDIVTEAELKAQFGDAAPDADGRKAYMAALTLRTTSLAKAAKALEAGEIPFIDEKDGRLIVPAKEADERDPGVHRVMGGIKYDNQGDALSRDVPATALALIDEGGNGSERRYSYGDLMRLSGAVARGLLKRGLQRGDRVAILSANRAEFLLTFLGTMQAGLVSVPVNWKLPAETVAYIVGDSDARLVIGDDARLRSRPTRCRRSPSTRTGTPSSTKGPFTPLEMKPEESAMFLYTSGSTGRPKGVVLSHYSHLWAMSQRVRRPVPQGQRSLVAAPLYHMNGLAMCQTTFSQGDTVVLLPQFTTRGYIEAAAKHKVGFLTSVPTMIAMMLREKELLAKTDLSAVEAVRMGSAPITQSLIDQVRAGVPQGRDQQRLRHDRGRARRVRPASQGLKQPELSTGYPHPEVQLRLVRDGKEVRR